MLENKEIITKDQCNRLAEILNCVNYEETKKTINALLKSDKGKGHRMPKRKKIREHLFYIDNALTMLRTVPKALNHVELRSLEYSKLINSIASTIDYDLANEVLYSGLQLYICQYEGEGKSGKDYLRKAKQVYSSVVDFMKLCEDFWDLQLSVRRAERNGKETNNEN